MSWVGHSHYGIIALTAAIVVLLFVITVNLTRPGRRAVAGALIGGMLAGAINVVTDAAAGALGFWRYSEVTTAFGPLLYYPIAGFGCAALALILFWLRRRGSSGLAFLSFWAFYAPIRDCAVAKTTHLIEFHYHPWLVVVIADSLSGVVVPILVAYFVIALFTTGASPRRLPSVPRSTPR
jgi:hypothetical protein